MDFNSVISLGGIISEKDRSASVICLYNKSSLDRIIKEFSIGASEFLHTHVLAYIYKEGLPESFYETAAYFHVECVESETYKGRYYPVVKLVKLTEVVGK